jgi:nicotinate-nucleotide--dimethylbenzimidazole phosphoribosyltransferase
MKSAPPVSPKSSTRRLPVLRRLADVRALIEDLPGPDDHARARAGKHEATLTKPEGALGRLEGLCAWLASWQGRHPPRIERAAACVFAANHGVASLGVSAYPSEVTRQMVANFEAGGAAVNALSRAFGVRLRVHALSLDTPTRDFTAAPAMDEAECVAALRAGMRAVRGKPDVVCLGEMGIGNTTSAAALSAALFGGSARRWVGPGTGIGASALAKKRTVVAAGLRRHRNARGDAIELLRRLGGRELAAIAGAVIAARLKRVPVLLDGFVCTAAAAVLEAAVAGALDHCQVAHRSAEPGHGHLLDAIAKEPIFDLNMRLGEASGAVLAVPVLRAACACHAGMATFADAGVSGRR